MRKTLSIITVISIFSTMSLPIVAIAEEVDKQETTVLSKKETLQAKEANLNETQQSSEKVIGEQQEHSDSDSLQENHIDVANSNEENVTENINDWMPDKNLQQAISNALNIPIQNITKKSLETLEEIEYRSSGNIQDLEGLQYAKNIKALRIRAKGLTNLSPIKSSSFLEELVLIDSSVSDFSVFDVNTSLRRLNLAPSKPYADSDRSTDVETLYDNDSVKQISEKFPNIVNLQLQGYCNGQSYTDFPTYTGKITDISPLSALKNLKTLDVSANEIIDFSMLPDTLEVGFSYQQCFLSKNVNYFEVPSTGARYTVNFPSIIGVDGTIQTTEAEYTTGKLLLPNNIYKLSLPFSVKSGGVAMYYEKVSTFKNQTSIEAHDSTLYVGDKWTAQDNFDHATDKDGNPVNFEDVLVTGSVDTTQPGKYKVAYSYNGVQKEIEVTVLQNQTSIEAHDSTLYVGDKWVAKDNFDRATDKDGNSVNFEDVQVTGSVDTTQPGKYKVAYSYNGVQKEIEVTVLQNQTSIEAHDSTLYVGDKWVAKDNFDRATDKDGNSVNFEDVQVTGSVDTTQPGKYKVAYSYNGVQKEIEVTVLQNQTSIEAHDSTLYVGDKWVAKDNFDRATDKDGNSVNFEDVQVTGSVDTTQPGKYKVTYSYNGVQKEIEVTVLQKTMTENSNITNTDNKKQNIVASSKNSNFSKSKSKFLPSTGEKTSSFIFVSGVLLLLYTSIFVVLRLKKKVIR
ncbi:bacterial Ig-like domain-containing protein [Enterococcus faecalis]|uniref:bacterial Ig-like domain-containing protein n=1 Tax=Enterococcus faecalis TaxID=1351 RepID=UPI0035C992AE